MHAAGAFSACGGCICYAFYSLATRMLSTIDPPETTMVYSGVAGTLAVLPLLPWFWTTPARRGCPG